MLLTLTTTHGPATDLGYLLRKNPARPQSFSLSFGKAHVFYPEATTELILRALGVPGSQAQRIVSLPLPELAPFAGPHA